ncbi:MAG TPA: NrfD/PsrC family molybdoenzyme membrane anchor subunit [Anaerolineaceae bacterium]
MQIENELPIVSPGHTAATVTDAILAPPMAPARKTSRLWILGFAVAFLGVMLFFLAVTELFVRGVGIWGINIPVAWGFAIINLVWWIGIGHAGTLISAILLLLRQEWRTSINRFAEAMTLFAVAQAAMFPILHLGRPWLFYWLLPYPNTQWLWPQFRSPLVWDAFAITTYALVSIVFWYLGLVPDLASMRDRATSKFAKVTYGVVALGWRNSARQWHHFLRTYWLLAALATPLVISVHSIIGMDFAYATVPGWHSTIFPPYFVAGAIFSGFAMVITLAVPLRKFFHFEGFITERHLDNMAKVMLAVGLIVAYGYIMEIATPLFGGDPNEITVALDRFRGAYSPFYIALLSINIGVTQLLWFKAIRSHPWVLWVVALLINTGMWLERFIIIVQSLHIDFLPSSWHMYWPTVWDIATYAGTIGLFFAMFFMFVRLLPSISIFEMRELVTRHHTPASGPEA